MAANQDQNLTSPTKRKLELVKFLINCSKIGYGKTRGECLNIVEAIVEKKGLKEAGDCMITHG